jgi:uncharacterized protein
MVLNMAQSKHLPKKNHKCPMCKNETHQDYKPFCSLRCANEDLRKWLSAEYVIQASLEEDPESIKNTTEIDT